MKITIKEDGSLIVDGENNTIVSAKIKQGIVLKDGGFYTDFIKIEGSKRGQQHSILNFIFKGSEGEMCFGDNLMIEGKEHKFIGIQSGRKIFWDSENSQVVIGYTKDEALNKRFYI